MAALPAADIPPPPLGLPAAFLGAVPSNASTAARRVSNCSIRFVNCARSCLSSKTLIVFTGGILTRAICHLSNCEAD